LKNPEAFKKLDEQFSALFDDCVQFNLNIQKIKSKLKIKKIENIETISYIK
jgi:hypothetical protein